MAQSGSSSGHSEANSSRSTILSTALLLFVFLAIFIFMIAALGRIYEAYEELETHLEASLRSLLRGGAPAAGLEAEMATTLAFLHKLERITTKVDLRSEVDRLDSLWEARSRNPAAPESEVGPLVEALELLEARLAASRSSLIRSYYSLLGALGLGLMLSLVAGITLWLRLRLSQLEAEWSQLSLKGSLAAEEELRRRIARDLHDDAAQDIAAARMLCDRAFAAASAEAARERAAEAAALLGGAGRKLRTLAMDLRPPELERSGLSAALESLCARSRDGSGREVEFRREGEAPPLPEGSAIQVYRIVHEAIMNASKHAPSHRIEVSIGPGLATGRSGLRILMRDFPDPGGSTPGLASPRLDDASSSGMGLAIMRERASIIGASLEIEAGEEGYELRLFVPAQTPAREKP